MTGTLLNGLTVPGRLGALAVSFAVVSASLAAPPRPGTPPTTPPQDQRDRTGTPADQRDRMPTDRGMGQHDRALSEADAMRIAEVMRQGNVSLPKAIEAAESHSNGKAIEARVRHGVATTDRPGQPRTTDRPATPDRSGAGAAQGTLIVEVTCIDRNNRLMVVNVDGRSGNVIDSRAFTDRSGADRSGWDRPGDRAAGDRPGMGHDRPESIVKASDFDGRDVVNAAGNKIGQIEELAVDVDRHRIAFAVLKVTDGPDRLVAVPWRALRHEDERCRLDLGANRRLADAPTFDREDWPDMGNEDFTTRVSNFFGNLFDWRDDDDDRDARDARDARDPRDSRDARDARDGARGTQGAPATRDGRDARDTRDPRDLRQHYGTSTIVRSSEVIGGDVRSQTNENLGDIEDLAIDPKSGRVAYAVVAFGGFLGFGEKLFAIPMDSFTRTADGKWVLAVSRDRLKDAPGFDKKNWPNMADPMFDTRIREFYGRPGTDRGTDRGTDPRQPRTGPGGTDPNRPQR